MGDYRAIGKRSMVDASCRVPFMIRCPGVQAQHRTEACSLVDVAPTLLKWAGADYDEEEFDGIDLFAGTKREYVYSQHGCGDAGTYMISDGQNKLIYRAAENRYYFFDHCPEERDCYDESNPTVQRMQRLLDEYRHSDKNAAVTSVTYEAVTKTHPHYPGRMDHHLLREQEAAAIPQGYTIDLN